MSEQAIEARRRQALEAFSLDQSENNVDAFRLIDGIRVHPDDVGKMMLFAEALAGLMVDSVESSISSATRVTITEDIITAGVDTVDGLWRNQVQELAKALFVAAGFEVVE